MKNFLPCNVGGVCGLLVLAGAICLANRCAAQDNVWSSPTSGYWQDSSWSLGVVPAANQTIWLTNYGWKAVEINAATAQSFPQSLNVDSINISSPTNSLNTLLLNYAGSGTPLTVKTMTVASNSAVNMVSSGLQINGPNGSGLMIGGEFNQNDSVVAGNQINVGYIGSGVYHFNSGYFTVSDLWLGDYYTQGTFYQNGGTNGFGITHLDGGTYVLNDGYYGATVYFDRGGQFEQFGGVLNTNLTLFNGYYFLNGGVHQGSTTVAAADGFSPGFAGVWQTGGTNRGSVDIGSQGNGLYTMSNGVAMAPNFTVSSKGNYWQWAGSLQVVGAISLHEEETSYNYYSLGQFYLHGGNVSSSGISVEGYYAQSGGTNNVAGDIAMRNVESSIVVSGGLLTMNNLKQNAGWVGGVTMTGGTMVITNLLDVGGINLPNWRGFSCGGLLVVSNIRLEAWAIFSCGNGVINQSGSIFMNNASLYSGTNSVQFGPLFLWGGNTGGVTNSTLYLVSPTSVINFADSSSQAWGTNALLIVEGWSGSLYGGGQQQIVFGKDSSALTGAQVAQIQFHNPAGLADGTYPARILSSGEIVPASGAALSASMALNPQPGGMQVILRAEAGHVYSIETSTDLVHWAAWTNQMNSNGTISITDTESKNYPVRYYRARLMP